MLIFKGGFYNMNTGVVKTNDDQGIVSFDNDMINNFKALYYTLNASPDNQIKVFSGSKEINLSDLYELNSAISRKMENHDLSVYNIAVNVTFTDNSIRNFENWSEFKRSDWTTSKRTKSVTMEWDFFDSIILTSVTLDTL